MTIEEIHKREAYKKGVREAEEALAKAAAEREKSENAPDVPNED